MLAELKEKGQRVNSIRVKSSDSLEQIGTEKSMSCDPVIVRADAYKPNDNSEMEDFENDDLDYKPMNETNVMNSTESQKVKQLKSAEEDRNESHIERVVSGHLRGGNSNISLHMVHPMNEETMAMDVETSDRSSLGILTPSPDSIRKQMIITRNSRISPSFDEERDLRKSDSRYI